MGLGGQTVRARRSVRVPAPTKKVAAQPPWAEVPGFVVLPPPEMCSMVSLALRPGMDGSGSIDLLQLMPTRKG